MKFVQYQVAERIATITLNRPEKRNALNPGVVADLLEAFTRAEQDDAVKVIILSANGDAFCAGADLEYLQQLQVFSYEENLEDSSRLKNLFQKIYESKKIVIAQVQGHAIAGGCGLATVCDFIFTVPEAGFGYTEVKIGFIPAIVMIFLLRKIGEARARALLLSGSIVPAMVARELGLVYKVVAREILSEEVLKFAREIVVANSAQAVSTTKEMLATVQSLSLDEALNYAAEMNAHARATEDCKKGIAAFLNKEKIAW